MEKLYLANHELKKSGITILISDQLDFNDGITTRSKINNLLMFIF